MNFRIPSFIDLEQRSSVNFWLAAALWMMVLSVFAVFRLAPFYLTADVIMNSVMSLQRITLFYWGQNRLLNVLPTLVYPIGNARLNLWAVLLITTTSYFAFLLAASAIVANALRANIFFVYLIMSSVGVVVLNDSGLAEIAILHIEYSMPALFVALAMNLVWYSLFSPVLLAPAVLVLISVAIWMNPSLLLVILFLVGSTWMLRRRVAAMDLVVAGIAVVAFASCMYVANLLIPAMSYGGFRLDLLTNGTVLALSSIVRHLDNPALLSAVLILMVLEVFRSSNEGRRPGQLFVIFAVGWILLFSASHWVLINEYSFRYFSVVAFGGIVVLAMWALLQLRGRRHLLGLAAAALATLCLSRIVAAPTSFKTYTAFAGTAEVSGAAFYAGDYWKVWPVVMRDAMDGRPSIGLAFRGEGNGEAAKKKVAQLLAADGIASVRCIGSPIPTCKEQAEFILGPLQWTGETRDHGGAIDLVFAARKS